MIKVKNMKVTIIKKTNVIVSLWLVSIIATLLVFGYQLNLNGFYIASIVLAGITLIMNTGVLCMGLFLAPKHAKEAKAQYRKY